MQIERDCLADGQLDKAYPRSELRRALSRYRNDVIEFSACDEVTRSQLSSYTHAAEVGSSQAVISECKRKGTLESRYSARALRRAADRLPADIKEYTYCRQVIMSQLIAVV